MEAVASRHQPRSGWAGWTAVLSPVISSQPSPAQNIDPNDAVVDSGRLR